MRKGYGGNKTLVFGIGLIAVLFIAAVIAVSYRAETEARLESSLAQSIAESEAEAALAAEASEDASLPEFSLCEDPLIISAVGDYFDCRLNADSSGIYELFGRKDTSENGTLEDKLKAEASWIQSFDDITVYTVPGVDEGEVFGIATYVVDFRRTDELAPGIFYFFAEYRDDGSVCFLENLLKDKVDYAEEMLDTDFASGLIARVNSELKTALENNSTLALIYTSFLNGDIYAEADIDINEEQQVDIFLDPQDSILVSRDVLDQIAAEAAAAASSEAAEARGDM